MARDYASGRKPARKKAARKPAASKRRSTASSSTSSSHPFKWYVAGVFSGIFISFMVYLGTLPAETAPDEAAATTQNQPEAAPRPRFDFYTLLPEQTIDVEVDPAEVTAPREGASPSGEVYLLQAGSFRQREDADRRRAELLLLGLQPDIEETSGDNGRWFRVYLGPFDSRSAMSRARSLTAGQDIDTLVLKRDPR
jgi:cell division protein FtsN